MVYFIQEKSRGIFAYMFLPRANLTFASATVQFSAT